MTPSHLVAHAQFSFGRYADFHHLQHAGWQLVAAFHMVKPAGQLLLKLFNPGPELPIQRISLGLGSGRTLHPPLVKAFDLLHDNREVLALANLLPSGRVDHLDPEDFVHLLDHLMEDLHNPAIHHRLVILHVLLELLFLLVRHVDASAKANGIDNHAFLASWQLEAVVFDILTSPAEDGMKQFFLGRKLALGLGRNLAHENIARPDASANLHHAVFVQVSQSLFRNIRNVPGKLFTAKFGLADLDLVLLHVQRCEGVSTDEFLADKDGVLKVIAIVGHERHQDISTQCQLAVTTGRAVSDNLPLLNPLALANDRPLVQARTLV